MYDGTRVAVIYHGTHGSVFRLACAVTAGAWDAGAEVRLRRVGASARHRARRGGVDEVGVASPDDLAWADVVLVGVPARARGIAAPLAEFIASAGMLSAAGTLAGKLYAAFTGAPDGRGAHDGALRSLVGVFVRWGGLLVPPGSTEPTRFRVHLPHAPAGVGGGRTSSRAQLWAAHTLGSRAAKTARALKSGRRRPTEAA
jgi:NAD(P)H dehydrogenase (quinone)